MLSEKALLSVWSRREEDDLTPSDSRTKTSLPERLQATQLKILGIKDADGKIQRHRQRDGRRRKDQVFVEDWEAPSTGRYYIAVGTEGTDRTGTRYWIVGIAVTGGRSEDRQRGTPEPYWIAASRGRYLN